MTLWILDHSNRVFGSVISCWRRSPSTIFSFFGMFACIRCIDALQSPNATLLSTTPYKCNHIFCNFLSLLLRNVRLTEGASERLSVILGSDTLNEFLRPLPTYKSRIRTQLSRQLSLSYLHHLAMSDAFLNFAVQLWNTVQQVEATQDVSEAKAFARAALYMLHDAAEVRGHDLSERQVADRRRHF